MLYFSERYGSHQTALEYNISRQYVFAKAVKIRHFVPKDPYKEDFFAYLADELPRRHPQNYDRTHIDAIENDVVECFNHKNNQPNEHDILYYIGIANDEMNSNYVFNVIDAYISGDDGSTVDDEPVNNNE